jgi:hypothetical protein
LCLLPLPRPYGGERSTKGFTTSSVSLAIAKFLLLCFLQASPSRHCVHDFLGEYTSGTHKVSRRVLTCSLPLDYICVKIIDYFDSGSGAQLCSLHRHGWQKHRCSQWCGVVAFLVNPYVFLISLFALLFDSYGDHLDMSRFSHVIRFTSAFLVFLLLLNLIQ